MIRIGTIEELAAAPVEGRALPEGQVDLWLVRPPADVDANLTGWLERILAASELERMRAFRFPADAARHGVGRALARLALSRYQAVDPAAWQFVTGERGRPEIDAPAAGLRFNLSHTHGLVACALSRHAVGVDVEDMARRGPSDGLLRYVCDAQEYEELSSLSEDQRTPLFYERWTLKESYMKALGAGLAIPPRTLSFAASGAPGARVASLRGSQGWHFSIMAPTDTHVLSVALQWPGERPVLRVEPMPMRP